METLLLLAITGTITGWLVSVQIRDSFVMLAANIAIGISGAFFGHWLVGQFNFFNLNPGLFTTMVIGAIGALVLLHLFRIMRLLA